jgi:hypothetical protein
MAIVIDAIANDAGPDEFRWIEAGGAIMLAVGMITTFRLAAIAKNYVAASERGHRERVAWLSLFAATMGIGALVYWLVQDEWGDGE